jgi:hypothetical protein
MFEVTDLKESFSENFCLCVNILGNVMCDKVSDKWITA